MKTNALILILVKVPIVLRILPFFSAPIFFVFVVFFPIEYNADFILLVLFFKRWPNLSSFLIIMLLGGILIETLDQMRPRGSRLFSCNFYLQYDGFRSFGIKSRLKLNSTVVPQKFDFKAIEICYSPS